MTIGQQWAVVLVLFWIASIWYAYSMGHLRGEASVYRKAAEHFSMSLDTPSQITTNQAGS